LGNTVPGYIVRGVSAATCIRITTVSLFASNAAAAVSPPRLLKYRPQPVLKLKAIYFRISRMLCGTGEAFSPRILLKDSKKQDKYAGLLFCSCLVDKWIRKNFKKKMGLLSKIFGDTKKLMTAKN
jgi:hypothetical protein